MSEERSAWGSLGDFIRSQRRLANLSVRQLANLAKVSNPYLSQVERGIYKPSAVVLKGIAEALKISVESLYAQAGLLEAAEPDPEPYGVEEAIKMDERLSEAQKDTLMRVYRGFVGEN